MHSKIDKLSSDAMNKENITDLNQVKIINQEKDIKNLYSMKRKNTCGMQVKILTTMKKKQSKKKAAAKQTVTQKRKAVNG
jgi:hypothetical protein